MKSTHSHAIHAEDDVPFFSWSPSLLYKEEFQQSSWKQNLFAFPHSTFNFLLSFVSVGIFPYFILFLLSPSERDFHWNSCSRGPAPMQGQKIIGQPIYPAVLFIFFFSFFPPPFPPQALDWSWSLQDDSCLLCISIANELEEKRSGASVCWATGLQSGPGERLSILTRCCQDAVGRGTADGGTGAWTRLCHHYLW